MPVAELVELSAGGDEGGGPDGAPSFAKGAAVFAEADCEVDVFDRDEVGVEAADRLEGCAGGPEGGEGEAVFGEVGDDHAGAADDAERPALGEDHGSAADDVSVLLKFFDGEAEEVGVKAGVGIDRDDEVSARGGEAGVADAGEVFGVFVCDDGAEVASDLFGAVGAAVEDDDGFDLTGGEFCCFCDGGEADGEVFFLVVGGDDDGDFHGVLRCGGRKSVGVLF